MSVTVRNYSKEELASIASGKDKLLATIFMNGSSFSERQMLHYPYKFRRTFACTWFGTDKVDTLTATVYAVDPRSLKDFLEMEYVVLPDVVSELVTTSTIVKLPKK